MHTLDQLLKKAIDAFQNLRNTLFATTQYLARRKRQGRSKQKINRLCNLQTNFEVRDVKILEDKVVWYIEHKDQAEYICSRCDKVHTYKTDLH